MFLAPDFGVADAYRRAEGRAGQLVAPALMVLSTRARRRAAGWPGRASTYFAVTSDSRNHAQVIDGGWSADYASADDFIGKLTCAYFVPGDSVATDDAGGFCDPGLDRQIARAAAEQTSNPAAAAAQWARLDRQLTDLAIWVPTVTPNEIDFLSSRVRNYQYNPVWGALIDQFWIR